MRITTFLSLVLVILAVCITCSGAESAHFVDQGRNLRAEQGGLAGKADDIVGSVFKREDIAAKFLTGVRKDAMLTKAATLEKAGKTLKAKILRAWAEPNSWLKKGQKEKLAQMFAEVPKKDPQKWSKTKKALVALGVFGAGTAAIYAAANAFKPTPTEAAS